MALKPAVKYGGIAIIVVAALIGGKMLLPKTASLASFIPEKTETKNIVVKDTPAYAYELPKQPESGFTGCPRVLSIPWNGTSALMLANGDVTTTPNSLVKQYSGGCVTLERQDDYSQMQNELLKFSQAFANGDETQGAPFAIIMGDGYPAFAASLKPQMQKLGQDFAVVTVMGFSYGEDKCMAPPTGGDPQKARGIVVAAVPRDGDQNICVKWAADNGIPVNTDNSVYDPTAINFVDTGSFTEADDKFIAGYSEQRDEAKGGIKTGKKVTATVNAVATWTPGDVTVVEKKGGVVSLADTKDYNQQMPTILIVNKAYAAKHKDFVVGLLRAIDRASVEIRTTPGGLKKASIVTAAVFGSGSGEESDPAYWSKYFVGFDQTDSHGNKVNLGGSRVVGLADAQDFFGLNTGTFNVYKGVYETFGDYNKKLYPKETPDYPAYESVVDTSYVVAAMQGVQTTRQAPVSTQRQTVSNVVSQQAISIEFETGSAVISQSSKAKLMKLANSIAMTNLAVKIDGHTDNTGDSDANISLSRQRAQAVATWLTNVAPETFPANRITVSGHGDLEPVDPSADQNTAAARAANRRVVITLGN